MKKLIKTVKQPPYQTKTSIHLMQSIHPKFTQRHVQVGEKMHRKKMHSRDFFYKKRALHLEGKRRGHR